MAGGGEDGETSLDAVKREAWEEAGLPAHAQYVALDSMTTIPVLSVVGSFLWGRAVYVIPEYSFGVRADKPELALSQEHTEYRWVRYEEAQRLLKWDSNKTALWELDQRLICQAPVPSTE
jgi:dATP pyrophosphohydrolase